jgi:hypothetical protein
VEPHARIVHGEDEADDNEVPELETATSVLCAMVPAPNPTRTAYQGKYDHVVIPPELLRFEMTAEQPQSHCHAGQDRRRGHDGDRPWLEVVRIVARDPRE